MAMQHPTRPYHHPGGPGDGPSSAREASFATACSAPGSPATYPLS